MGDKPTIYLAGPVAAYDDGGRAWRQDVIQTFGDEYEFRSPLSWYNAPADELDIVDPPTDGDGEVSVRELVEMDKRLIRESDAVLVGYEDVQSIGTPMEVQYAYGRHIPVAIWNRDGTSHEDMSPWYRYHATIWPNVDRALDSLEVAVND